MNLHRYSPAGTYSREYENACNKCAALFGQALPYPSIDASAILSAIVLEGSEPGYRGTNSILSRLTATVRRNVFGSSLTSEHVRAGFAPTVRARIDVAHTVSGAWIRLMEWNASSLPGHMTERAADMTEGAARAYILGSAARSAVTADLTERGQTKDAARWSAYFATRVDDTDNSGPEGHTNGHAMQAEPVRVASVTRGNEERTLRSLSVRDSAGLLRFPTLLAYAEAEARNVGTTVSGNTSEATRLLGRNGSTARDSVKRAAKSEYLEWSATRSDETVAFDVNAWLDLQAGDLEGYSVH